jgi:hypothetical protein
MPRQASHYSTYLTQIAALIGIPADRITTEIAAVLNATFNTAIAKMWDDAPWIEISPYGEARFLGNRLSYPNNQANSTYWTATAATLTANSISNPADGFTTATKMMETGASSAHSVAQSVTTFYPSTSYTVSFYARPNGRIWQYLSVTDGVTTYTAFFNTSAGTVGTTTNFTSTTIAQQPNGFWLCQATFTANAAATTSGSYTLQLSTDGSTLSYAGDTSKGCYLWGALVQQTQYTPVQDLVLSWDQLGENEIDAVYNIWPCSPFTSNYPSQFGYNITPQGIQVINGTPYAYVNYQNGVAQNNLYGAPPSNPIFVYYRKTCPQYTGDVFDAADTYSVNEQVYFTASDGYGDFYKCIVATSAGQSPTTTPNSWERITLFDTFLQFCIYQAFGDWLISDGQFDKAQLVYGIAESKMGDQLDKNERQMDVMSPMKVQSHLTSRPAY